MDLSVNSNVDLNVNLKVDLKVDFDMLSSKLKDELSMLSFQSHFLPEIFHASST